MARSIYLVSAQILDANAAFHELDGYPKTFDSKNYGGDEEKAKKRAESDMYATWSAMCLRDDRLAQVVYMTDIFGNILDRKSIGGFPA